MILSTFNPRNIEEFERSKLDTDYQCARTTCPAGTSVNLDLTIADDYLLAGFILLGKNTALADTVTFQIYDIVGELPCGLVFPPETVIKQFVTNAAIPTDSDTKINEQAIYPAKILAGLTIRCIYTSTGVTDVDLAINYKLHKILI